MLASQVIKQLQKLIEENGDRPVAVSSYDDGSGLVEPGPAYLLNLVENEDDPFLDIPEGLYILLTL